MRAAVRPKPQDGQVSRRSPVRVAAAVITLAAAPTFTLMALVTSAWGSQPGQMICADGAAHGGMTGMYLLMAAFHLSPWLRLMDVGRRQPERT